MDNNTRICKICNRCFSSGKAMGGHMRSHLAKLPFHRTKPTNKNNDITSPSPPPSSSSSFHFPATTPPVQSYRSLTMELCRKNDTDGATTPASLQKLKRPRSSNGRKRLLEDSSEQVSSLTDDVFSEEDVAICLVMLSRDKRTSMVKDNEGVVFHNDDDCSAEECEDEIKTFKASRVGSKASTKYKCLLCNKEFKSYQALGGHKANHRRMEKEGDLKTENKLENKDENVIEHRRFKCPFCQKSFDSGQALGGHKKIHFAYLDPISITNDYNYARTKYPVKPRMKDLLDLNLPAPQEEDGDCEVS